MLPRLLPSEGCAAVYRSAATARGPPKPNVLHAIGAVVPTAVRMSTGCGALLLVQKPGL